MKISLRLTATLCAQLQEDLRRPHAFAQERVAFVFGRQARSSDELMIVLSTFEAALDEHYEEDETVGARIGPLAINRALRTAASLRTAAFHVHEHPHRGMPRFSSTDLRELPGVMDPFQFVVREQPRGLIVLSHDSCAAIAWLPGETTPRPVTRTTIAGAPLRVIEAPR